MIRGQSCRTVSLHSGGASTLATPWGKAPLGVLGCAALAEGSDLLLVTFLHRSRVRARAMRGVRIHEVGAPDAPPDPHEHESAFPKIHRCGAKITDTDILEAAGYLLAKPQNKQGTAGWKTRMGNNASGASRSFS